ncbi:MAG: UDP-N-acetylmuramate--L-alanine ligase [Alphaproteobacteria bacterium 16-39-46]|nr:MAG: UDP-N-acetylmuramate--L-alanine ligase [Alphaproteobacteria bacterium 16-39-46]OZA43957.1 MAG: UDP-N-acetylmuramate--L-alanine ligase [Alphaproteobacteria bacterium 17-39-52]HQS83465.1 UDP-N-acetylmuramate--L-alanine ligase [Alphaproteobacteria bacterium]HQS93259.1 UDP-N-acetylmuramate--L-alanine ligase [Alphaproteobacteria bacterium]
MKISPLSLGVIHFVGIGGIGMSGIAEILHGLGQKVQGSDITPNSNVQRLKEKGIPVFIGHQAENIEKANLLVVSSAIGGHNPEIEEAKRRGIAIVHRSEMLAQLARLKFSAIVSGSHGKTTTTSLIAAIFDAALLDPTVINGGIITAYGTNARLGKGDWMIIESDESDGSFVDLSPTVAVVTNIDPEHLEHYGSFDKLKEAFQNFVEKIPFYGFGVLCIDHPVVAEMISKISNKTLLTYGFSEQAHVRAFNILREKDQTTFDVEIKLPQKPVVLWKGLQIALMGDHNILNVLAALTVAHKLEIPRGFIQEALSSFKGVKRRFTKVGDVSGITIYDDYAHHPVEISATLKAALGMTKGRVISVLQPHRYSRVARLMDDFAESLKGSTHVYVLPIYGAGEEPVENVDHNVLSLKMKERGIPVLSLSGKDELFKELSSFIREGDVVLFMGAGTISQWAYAFSESLLDLRQETQG